MNDYAWRNGNKLKQKSWPVSKHRTILADIAGMMERDLSFDTHYSQIYRFFQPLQLNARDNILKYCTSASSLTVTSSLSMIISFYAK
jgi:hypothetical protein